MHLKRASNNGMIIKNLERMHKEVWTNLRYYPGI
jgi:hypothetical protein